jgi:phosphatidylglycerophosphate synthase
MNATLISSSLSRAAGPDRAANPERRMPSATSTASASPSREEFTCATRSLTSVLATVEKRTLIWLAHRMPGWVNSDHLTALALVSMILAGFSYWLASLTAVGLLLAVACLALNWFGDSLDGTLARVRDCQRPRYGFYVDHIVDALGALFLLGGLGLSGYMNPLVAAGVLVVYLLLLVETFLATHTLRVFRMSYFKVGPTELRILLAIGNLALLLHPTANLFGREYHLFDVGGAVAIAGLLFTLGVATITNALTLYRAEPVPSRGPAQMNIRGIAR